MSRQPTWSCHARPGATGIAFPGRMPAGTQDEAGKLNRMENVSRAPWIPGRQIPRAVLRFVAGWFALCLLIPSGAFAQETDRFPELGTEARAALAHAVRLEKERRLAEAVRWLEEKVKSYDHPQLFAYLGNLQYALGRHDRAIQAYRQALRTTPDHPATLKNLAAILIQKGQHAEAARVLSRALGRGVLNSDQIKMLARIHLEERADLDAAEAVYRHALLLEPDDVNVRIGLIITQYRKRDLDAAIRTAEQALEVFPFHPRLCALLANALLVKGELGPAADLLEMLRLLGRATPRELRTLADLHYREKLFREAAATYGEAVAAGIRDEETLLRHGQALHLAGKLAKAEAALAQLVTAHPRNGRAWLGLGRIRAENGQGSAALEAYRRATTLLPDQGEAHLSLALLYLDQGRLDEAEQAFVEAARDQKTASRAWKGLGATALKRGERTLAIRNYRHALTLNPDDPELHHILDQLEERP
jgi:tetratricopeptide (TPR) repeat protein